MLRLADPDHAFAHPVTVPVPTEDGQILEQTFTAEFVLLPADTVQGLIAEGDEAVIQAALKGWDGIEDHDGTALAFNGEHLTTLVNILYWRRAVVDAYFRFVAGFGAKNSSTPPAPS